MFLYFSPFAVWPYTFYSYPGNMKAAVIERKEKERR
jgi:hypothetical protein